VFAGAGAAGAAVDPSAVGVGAAAGAGVELLHPPNTNVAERKKLAARAGNFSRMANLLLRASQLKAMYSYSRADFCNRSCPRKLPVLSTHQTASFPLVTWQPHARQALKNDTANEKSRTGNKLKQYLVTEVKRLRKGPG
jgi:hypothetical protein